MRSFNLLSILFIHFLFLLFSTNVLASDPIDCQDPRVLNGEARVGPLNHDYFAPKIDYSLSSQTHFMGEILEFVPGELYDLHRDSIFTNPLDSISLRDCWTNELTNTMYCHYDQFFCGVIVEGGYSRFKLISGQHMELLK